METVDGQPFTLFPAADGGDVSPQKRGNLLPGFQATPLSIRTDLRVCCRLDRHEPENSC